MICDNLGVTAAGQLTFAGRTARELTEKYGSPLYVMDENRIRYNLKVYVDTLREVFGEDALALYASKACAFKEMYRLADACGAGCDVVSAGELYTAYKAGFPMEKVYFHGNSKTDGEIALGLDLNVGCFVVDHLEEVDAIETIAAQKGKVAGVLLRITPGIDTHTYEAVATGQVDSKFGCAIETGQAREITAHTLKQPHIQLRGFHCHVGSQVFDSDTFFRSADIMLAFIAEMRDTLGYVAKELDLGGGYGVRYLDTDPTIDIADNIRQVGAHVKAACERLSLPLPAMRMEPGRSIVADAGITLYTVGSVKRIPGYKNYVSVDGGMSDNPRYALYEAPYTVVCPEKMNEPCDFTCDLVGKCCESGDIIQPHIHLPASVKRGDLVAVLTTGAYNYSMASNYNRIPRLPVIMLTDNGEKVVVKRETLDDIIRNDV